MPRPPPTTAAAAPASLKSMAYARLSFACPGVHQTTYQKAYDRYYSSRRDLRHGCVTADRRATGGRFGAAGPSARTACVVAILTEVPVVAKQASAEKRQRRERG